MVVPNEDQSSDKKLGVDEKTILIGIVGRLTEIKNHQMFLETVKRFRENQADSPVRFVIIGDGSLRR